MEVISWGARSYDQPVVTKKVSYDLAPLGSKVVTTMPIKSSLANSSLTLMDAVVRLRATAEGDSKGEWSATHRDTGSSRPLSKYIIRAGPHSRRAREVAVSS